MMNQNPKHYRTFPNDFSPENDRIHDPEEMDEYLPHISGVASSQECTGLMPRPPKNEAEEESYRDLYSGEIPES